MATKLKNSTWWVVALKGAFVGQLYVSEAGARWTWGDQEGATFHKVKLVPVKKKKAKRKA